MGAYNVVIGGNEVCDNCGSVIRRRFQFKYGDTWDYTYLVGDSVRWGRHNIGEPGHNLVVVEAAPEECPVCGCVPENGDFVVTLRRDVIERIEPSSNVHKFIGENTYLVLDP